MKKIETNLSNLKSKADRLDADKLIPAPVYLSKLSEVVKNVIKKDVYNAKIINIKGKKPSNTNLATNDSLNAKINEVKNKIPNIANLATTAGLTAVENKIPNVNNLVKKKTKKLAITRKLVKLRKNHYCKWL